ncbi:PIN domain-containing protein [uncultured Thiohalocapsa sp.]|uniref:PIN domain-containing protein n=1 Tax=uncultured Thiohalocapsa sp. TaxID=768990 RepID=UPI00345D56E7
MPMGSFLRADMGASGRVGRIGSLTPGAWGGQGITDAGGSVARCNGSAVGSAGRAPNLGLSSGGVALGFDDRAARAYAEIARSTTAAGSPIGLADGLIAAIAHARGFAVASRDTAPFRAAGVDAMDPWDTA